MTQRWNAPWSLVVALAGCVANEAPAPRSCVQLGWSCGVDDNAHSCGRCLYGQTCDHGTCTGTAAACAVEPYRRCSSDGPSCCPMRDGRATVCWTDLPTCLPTCTRDEDCTVDVESRPDWQCSDVSPGVRACRVRFRL